MLRGLVAALAGIFAATLTIVAIEMAGQQLTGERAVDPAAVAAMNPEALAILTISWFVGCLVGGLVAVRIARRRAPLSIVAGFVLLYALATFLAIPHPVWTIVGGVLAPLFAAWLAWRVGCGVGYVVTPSPRPDP